MTSTISRRQIISRSRDAGIDRYGGKHGDRFAPYEDYEEMWFSHEQLFKDHIAEVFRKWEQIDDEIWAKMIFMSRNRRIAKAYVRVPAVIIDGTDNGFDGYRVGLNGFEDPFRDSQTGQLMNHIGKGCRIGIDEMGNILIKRYSQSRVFVKSYPLDYSRSCVDNSVIRANGSLEQQKKYVLFDMGKFELAIMEELKCAYPDRSKLEQQCITVIGFVRDNVNSILDMPIYLMIINIVALDMLKSKLNPVIFQSISQPAQCVRVPQFVSIFNQMESSCCKNDDEEDEIYGHIGEGGGDFWSNNSQHLKQYTPQSMPTLNRIQNSRHTLFHTSSNEDECSSKPPKLPPRDRKKLSKQINTIKSARSGARIVEIPSPDYPDEYLPVQSSNTKKQVNSFENEQAKSTRKNIMIKTMDNGRKSKRAYGGCIVSEKTAPLLISNLPYRSVSKSHSHSIINVYSNNNNNNNTNGLNMNKSLRANLNLTSRFEEDPYYYGLEARVTSNKLNNSPVDQATSKMKGLNWMMRKVLSANYINMLTSKRHKKKIPKSKSSNESSTDSDPYVSINDMYEPIYGYNNLNSRISQGWSTIQGRIKH